ncbi:hypothetical protein Slala03_79740 [Streptomyces lavendulae subsp. lavendulae]|nr:hypothetical protein Slala03_79740 [Streptomyces lavendulae subsp. lavendulae]
MRWAATQAGDPLLDAVCSYVRAETFLAARAHTAGLRALETALDAAPASNPAGKAARGSLHMRAAVLAGRAGDAQTAHAHIREARALGDRIPEGVYQGTAFGPESVRIHQVSLGVSLGGGYIRESLGVAREWKPSPARRAAVRVLHRARPRPAAGRPRRRRLRVPESRPEHRPAAHERAPVGPGDAGTLRRLKRADTESLTGFAEWIGAV